MSVQDVEKPHKDYARIKSDATLIADMMDDQATRAKCLADHKTIESYLMMPLSHENEDKAKELKRYTDYLYHAFLPEYIVSDALEEMAGICFKVDPVIRLPEKIQYMERHANGRGDSLLAVVDQALRDVIEGGGAAISPDYLEGRAVIAHKPNSSIYNWRLSSRGLTMLVLSESYTDENGETKEQRRHYSVESGTLVVTLYRQSAAGKWAEHIELDERGNAKPAPTLPNNKPYDFIPVRVARMRKPPLLAMAKTVLKGFQISADYYGANHNNTPTFVLNTDNKVQRLAVGVGNGLQIGKDDKAGFAHPGLDGSEPNRIAMETQFNAAIDQGVRLVSNNSSTESGEALYLRNANKQIKADAVAGKVSAEVTEALRVCAMLEGADPDEVEFRLKVELVEEPIDTATLKEMREGVVEGLIKHEDYVLALHSAKPISLDIGEDGTPDTIGYIKEAAKQHAALTAEPEQV